MDKNQKFWLSIWIIVGIVTCILIISTALYNYQDDKLFVKAGYQHTTLVGMNGYYWKKVK